MISLKFVGKKLQVADQRTGWVKNGADAARDNAITILTERRIAEAATWVVLSQGCVYVCVCV